MSRKVMPQSMRKMSMHSHVHSTSRHQLRPIEHEEIEQSKQFNLNNIKMKFFLDLLIRKIRFLSPPKENTKNMKQTWENHQDDDQQFQKNKRSQQHSKETLSEQIYNRYEILKYFQVIEGLFVIIFCWFVSVSITFQAQLGTEIAFIMMFFILFEIAIKMKIIKDDQSKEETTYEIQAMQDFVYPIMLIFACALMILKNKINVYEFQYIIAAYQLICIFIHWKRIGRYFQSITRFAEQYKMRKELRIIELFCFTLVMAHIFGLLMYSMTYLCPPGKQTWVQKANLYGEPWYILYIYSYYWANTTMVTVGYGDISPSNFVQAIFVTIIQVVGTAVFGYMINVIGITVNQIQKKNLQFQQSLGTIHKLQKHYNLTRELCYKMKKDIIKKQIEQSQTPLKNNEEKEFLQYVDESLKEQFVLETNMKVIKKTIFFLTYFTINFQNEIALKLIRCIYKPNQIISLEQNGEKQLAIINNGKVNIYCQYNHHTIQKKVLCKTIEPIQDHVSLNLYGYSTLILNRNSNLKAITEDTTTVYILKCNDVMQSLHNSILDFESFHEMRQKFSQVRRLQEIEIPAINQIEKHYLPNIYFLLNKIRKEIQPRLYINRGKRRMPKKVITLKHYQNKTILIIPQNRDFQYQENYDSLPDMDFNEGVTSIKNIEKHNQSKGPKSICIDQNRNFQKFMKKCNINVISQKYERFCLKKNLKSRHKRFDSKSSGYRTLTFE